MSRAERTGLGRARDRGSAQDDLVNAILLHGGGGDDVTLGGVLGLVGGGERS